MAVNADGILVKVALTPSPEAIGIIAASYDPRRRQVGLTLADGRKLLLTAGQHIEEAREW